MTPDTVKEMYKLISDRDRILRSVKLVDTTKIYQVYLSEHTAVEIPGKYVKSKMEEDLITIEDEMKMHGIDIPPRK